MVQDLAKRGDQRKFQKAMAKAGGTFAIFPVREYNQTRREGWL
jgi:hypothetical protein